MSIFPEDRLYISKIAFITTQEIEDEALICTQLDIADTLEIQDGQEVEFVTE